MGFGAAGALSVHDQLHSVGTLPGLVATKLHAASSLSEIRGHGMKAVLEIVHMNNVPSTYELLW